MAEDTVVMETETGADAGSSRVYEAGYHISPSVNEEDIEALVAGLRAVVEQNGGSFIAEGAPVLTKLAFSIFGTEAGKSAEFDRGYFGWLKFEASLEAADLLKVTLEKHPSIFRSMVFRTVREETRAKMKAPQLREVKRTDTIKATPRKTEESAPVSEVDLEKALQDITTD